MFHVHILQLSKNQIVLFFIDFFIWISNISSKKDRSLFSQYLCDKIQTEWRNDYWVNNLFIEEKQSWWKNHNLDNTSIRKQLGLSCNINISYQICYKQFQLWYLRPQVSFYMLLETINYRTSIVVPFLTANFVETHKSRDFLSLWN